MQKYEDSLRGYGHPVHLRCNFRCVYCGYDGRAFPNWLQLAVDHIVPVSRGGADTDDNKVTVCHACNSITSRMIFESHLTREEIVAKKRERVRERQAEYLEFWKREVAPRYVEEWKGAPAR